LRALAVALLDPGARALSKASGPTSQAMFAVFGKERRPVRPFDDERLDEQLEGLLATPPRQSRRDRKRDPKPEGDEEASSRSRAQPEAHAPPLPLGEMLMAFVLAALASSLVHALGGSAFLAELYEAARNGMVGLLR